MDEVHGRGVGTVAWDDLCYVNLLSCIILNNSKESEPSVALEALRLQQRGTEQLRVLGKKSWMYLIS